MDEAPGLVAGQTLRLRGEGGAEWDQDVAADGTVQRELLEDHIAKGRIEVLGGVVTTDDAEAAAAGRPNVRDGKAEWVTYAIAQGGDPDDVSAMSKDDLIKRYGARES